MGWPFYPTHPPKTQHLKHYSSVFGITEINSTFYRIPSRSMTTRWFHETPENFVFTAKLPKIITHENRLRPRPYLDLFIQSVQPLGHKLKVIVIQLPPSLTFEESEERLVKMINHFPKSFRYVVEGRNESWFSDKVFDYFQEKNISLAWNQVEGIENPVPITADLLYLRLIGDRSIDEKDFGKIQKDRKKEMEKWIEKLKKANVELAMVMLNNHFAGFAPGSANEFRELLGLEALSFGDKMQKSIGDF